MRTKLQVTFFIRISVLAFFFFNACLLFAQIPTQTLRGKIFDTDNQEALVGASILLLKTTPDLGTISDENGNFRLENTPLGRYQLQVSFIGYETLIISEVLVEAGKETILEIALSENSEALKQIVVKAARKTTTALQPVSAYTMTVEETFRVPATFYDPARLAMVYPGVVNDNDQTNSISVRGNSPATVQWRLEGIEIVNPNHLSNAGTFSDRPAQSAGGVNILSAQMLGTSTFLTGAFPAEYGNVLGGVLDMRLRKGNNEQHEMIGQAGLLGFDFAAEGPISEKSEASYLVNYRYSFVGLLTSLGVDFGGEAIQFQDAAFHFSFPTQKLGKFTLFGMGGDSENIFTRRDSLDRMEEKDLRNITYKGKMGAAGLTHSIGIGRKSSWHSAVVYSGYENERYSNILQQTQDEVDLLSEQKISVKTGLQTKFFRDQITLKTGVQGTRQLYNVESWFGWLSEPYGVGVKTKTWLWQYYLNFKAQIHPKVEIAMGFHSLLFTLGKGDAYVNPRGSIKWQLRSEQNLRLAYGRHSQLQTPQTYFVLDAELIEGNANLNMTHAQHLVLGYRKMFRDSAMLNVEVYYQKLDNVPVASESDSTFSVLNFSENFQRQQLQLQNDGTGMNYGLDVLFQKYLTQGYYYLLSSSLFKSTYTTTEGGTVFDSRFDNNFTGSLTVGKEFQSVKKEKVRFFGVNFRVFISGGLRTRTIDETASELMGYTIFDDNGFPEKLPAYFRTDLRLYWKKNKPRYTSTLAIDLQNLTNRKNVAYRYFDTFQNKVVERKQLGLIPNLTYRIAFSLKKK